MIFETNEWKLEIIPRFVPKKLETQVKECPHCNGSGEETEDQNDFNIFHLRRDCTWCNGDGSRVIKLSPEMPPPPIEMDFIEYMRECVKKYKERT